MKINHINIVGAGSLGGFQVFLLSKMSAHLGCRITVFDFDKVELRNVQNQIYRSVDVGRPKTSSLKKIIKYVSGTDLIVRNIKVSNNNDLNGVVIVLVDSMQSRKMIFEASRYNAGVDYYIEARTGGNIAMVYAFDPRDPDWVKRYGDTLYDDSEVVNPVCALPDTVPVLWAVASVISSLLVRITNERIFKNEFLETVINMQDLPIVTSSWYYHI